MDISNILNQVEKLLPKIEDETAKIITSLLFRIIEEQSKIIEELKINNQKLKDENNRLKKEDGKPDIKPRNRKKKEKKGNNNNSDYSSETERKNSKKSFSKNHKKGTKKDKIEITLEEICKVDKSELPIDAVFQGYRDVVVQDLKIETFNTLFKKEVYHSKLENKTYTGKLPKGYLGEFGPHIKSFILLSKHVCNMSEPKILEILTQYKIKISLGSISNILLKGNESFHKEKDEIVDAGLEFGNYVQTDDTSARVRGENHYTHILSHSFFTAYFTESHKDRMTILKILLNKRDLEFVINSKTLEITKILKVGKKDREKLKTLISKTSYSESKFKELLKKEIPTLKPQIKQIILDASAISSYQNRTDIPIVDILVCDDAPQFKLLTKYLSLCWVHEGRHYKKLSPIIPLYTQKLEKILTQFWDFYHKLIKYKEKPTKEMKNQLSKEFDDIFSQKTGYLDLDNRINKTMKKKENLLLVLEYPQLPLHNNDAELAARVQVRRRDVSLHTMSNKGTKTLDTFMTIVETSKKNSVNIYDYILDRVKKNFHMESLADIIKRKSTMKCSYG